MNNIRYVRIVESDGDLLRQRGICDIFEIDEAKNSIGLLGFVANVAVSQCAIYAEFWKKTHEKPEGGVVHESQFIDRS